MKNTPNRIQRLMLHVHAKLCRLLFGFNSGTYISGHYGDVVISPTAHIGRNVAFICNKDPYSRRAENPKIVIGGNCLIGFNCVILGGVVLGDNTVVGAGSVVTRSFPGGNCVIVGSPARKIRALKTGGII